MTVAEIRAALNDDHPSSDYVGTGEKAPAQVKGVPRLRDDALVALFDPPIPPRRAIQLTSSAMAAYQFGDASGTGFGSSLMINNTFYYRHGQWASDHHVESSNFRELANLVYAIEEALLTTQLLRAPFIKAHLLVGAYLTWSCVFGSFRCMVALPSTLCMWQVNV
jgi:hypothetical protein